MCMTEFAEIFNCMCNYKDNRRELPGNLDYISMYLYFGKSSLHETVVANQHKHLIVNLHE